MGLIIISAILILAVSYLLISEFTIPRYEDNEKILFSSMNKASVNYTVLLKPNSLFEGRTLEQGKSIITEYVDYIRASYDYHYTGSQKSDVTGSYEIIGIMEAYSGDSENKTTIWEKKYVLSPKIQFERKGKEEFTISKDIDIKLADYNDFARLIAAESKINASTRLSIFMNIAIKSESDNGVIEEILAPGLVIPLMNNHFIIDGNLTEEKPSEIKETVKQIIPVNYKKVYILIAFDVFLVMLLVFILFFTGIKEIDWHEKFLLQIFRKHGDRMVALKNRVSDTYEHQYEVHSIDDLVRVSDEIEKPIVYKFCENKNDIDRFFVINEKELYFFSIDNESADHPETVKNLLESFAMDKWD